MTTENSSSTDKEPTESQSEKKQRKSQADMMVELATYGEVRMFRDQRGDPYTQLLQDDISKTLKLRTRPIRVWLAKLLWDEKQKVPGNEALNSALNVLEAMAYEGPTLPLYNRVAPDGLGGIYIDIGDEYWQAIHVTKEGWRIVESAPILFRRYSHQKPLPLPIQGGTVDPLLDFINVKDQGDQLLYIVSVVSSFIPWIPHPIMVLHGTQGSGKTWALRAARTVIDPSALDLLTLPRKQEELVQALDHNYCAYFDNVGRLPYWISDILCRAVTGTGLSKRKLYTDDEDVIYEFRRCVGLTDINIAAERGDLLDRSILIGLENLEKEARKTEKELKVHLNDKAGEILGGILDILVRALNEYDHVKVDYLHRMADFTRWGAAITKAMGLDPQIFLDAYRENVERQSLETIRASAVADVLINFIQTRLDGSWSGTASQLLSVLNEFAKEMNISTRQKAWPKNPRLLSRHLNELAPSLPVEGIVIERGYRGKTRIIRIISVGNVGASVGTDATDDTDAADDTFQSKTLTETREEAIRKILVRSGGEAGILLLQNQLERQGHSLEGLPDELAHLEYREKVVVTPNSVALGSEWRDGI